MLSSRHNLLEIDYQKLESVFLFFILKKRWKLVNNNETSKITTETPEVESGQDSSLVSDIVEVGENDENEIFRDNDGWDLL